MSREVSIFVIAYDNMGVSGFFPSKALKIKIYEKSGILSTFGRLLPMATKDTRNSLRPAARCFLEIGGRQVVARLVQLRSSRSLTRVRSGSWDQ